MKIRLQKIIANAGLASRRQAEEWITQGKVHVNGQPEKRLGTLADPETDRIIVRGRALPSIKKKVYLILNKPPNCVTTTKDDRKRSTVMDCIKKVPERVFPVGRLDYNTQGVLLFTNDGELSEKLLNPKYKVWRTYQVKVRGVPDEKVLDKLRGGYPLDGVVTAPMRVHVIRSSGKNCFLTMKLVEGKNRHIKRVCEGVGFPVIKLKRTHFASLNLIGLPLGQFRYLTRKEIESLKTLVS